MKLVLRILNLIVPVAAMALFNTGCTSEGFTLGGKYLDSNIRTVRIDTCSLKFSTVCIDSVATSRKSRGFVGRYKDDIWGRIYATTYIEYSTPSKESFSETIHYDSIAMVMQLNGLYMGDTTKEHTINIYKLNSPIVEPELGTSYYNTDTMYFNPVPIASRTFKPRPHTKFDINNPHCPKETKYFTIRLDDDVLGQTLLDMITDGESVGIKDDDFLDVLPGFAVAADMQEGKNNIVLGFDMATDTSFAVRLYYHYSTDRLVKKTTDITVNRQSGGECFYGFRTKRAGSAFAGLEENKVKGVPTQLPSSKSQNMALVQALTASYVKIEIPYLNNLLEHGEFGAITEAMLLLYPVQKSFHNPDALPKSVVLFTIDENNTSLEGIANYEGNALQTGSLTKDFQYNKETYYTYDITSFLNGQLGAYGRYKQSLQLIVPEDSLATSLNTLTFGDQKFAEDKTRLIVKYLIYENE